MTSATRIPISLLAIILLLVPGLVALEIYYRRTGKQSKLSRIQWVVFSVFLSLFSLLLLYVSTPIYFDQLTDIVESLSTSLNIVNDEELFSMSIPIMTVFYIIHVGVSLVIGRVIGELDDRCLNPDRVLDRRPPWQYAFDEANSEEIEVKLRDGTVIQGQFNEAAWDKEEHELYIEDPYEVEYDGEELVGDPIDLGRSILLKGSAITHVLFTEEDPYTEMEINSEEIATEIEGELDEILHDLGEQAELSSFEIQAEEEESESQEE
ncbi:hypothetical protein Htur_1408 [Haloterrigena turkmenica DSM 5511]|uniref:Uncharacterized protein n=1 Tax=Haloterrigena turkmenica (strain ATCC 51198 / DSM 5511 / JCM 9101 / NCIMB 13204 / VKM B-1734 / 4k) TaxID=543526 RepID=D2RQ37_HALTV|nr:DUF6338 family protein [Haloterrigena turkmenica]ADB60296.1 hypothetical protein Htur_1408 [Haloterrigena turkmenica DSM 5511]